MIYSRLICFATALSPTAAWFGFSSNNNTETSGMETLSPPPYGLTFTNHWKKDPYRRSLNDISQKKIDQQTTWYDRVNLKDRQLYDGLKFCIAEHAIESYKWHEYKIFGLLPLGEIELDLVKITKKVHEHLVDLPAEGEHSDFDIFDSLVKEDSCIGKMLPSNGSRMPEWFLVASGFYDVFPTAHKQYKTNSENPFHPDFKNQAEQVNEQAAATKNQALARGKNVRNKEIEQVAAASDQAASDYTGSSGVKDLPLPPGFTFESHRFTGGDRYRRSLKKIEEGVILYGRELMNLMFYDELKFCIAENAIEKYEALLRKGEKEERTVDLVTITNKVHKKFVELAKEKELAGYKSVHVDENSCIGKMFPYKGNDRMPLCLTNEIKTSPVQRPFSP